MPTTLEYDASTRMAMKLGTAIVKAIHEHGAPNSFAISELVGPRDAMAAGKALRKHWVALCLNVASRLSDEFKDDGVHINFSGGRIVATTHESRKHPRAKAGT